MSPTSRLALRLRSLPYEAILAFAAEAAATSPALHSEANRRIAQHAPTPEWALSKVLLSRDLAPVIVGKLGLEDFAAAKVCKLWQAAWTSTRNQRPWLRPAPVQPLPENAFENVNVTHIYSPTELPGGERLCVAANGTDGACRLLVLDRSFQVLHSIPRQEEASDLLGTQLGLYDWSDGVIRRSQLEEDGTLSELAEGPLRSTNLCEEICEVAAAPDGTLFASVQGMEHGVAVLDPLTVEEMFRFGGGYFRAIASLCVVNTELYVCDRVRLSGSAFGSAFGSPSPFGRFQVFALSGEYLREVRVDGMQDPRRLRFINGLLYLLDAMPDGGSRIFVLTPDGVTLQTYDAPRLSPANLCPFAGGLLLTGTSGSELGPRHLERLAGL